ncbi:MAG: FAD-binding oxidoreductase [Vicinamibacteria bacterium]|nr:FAD-binding oxidoreductase [Vicinamibacteria bacterium]
MTQESMLSGWGRVFGPGREVASEDVEAITRDATLTRGLARSYGDSSLPHPSDGVVASCRLADRILSFDEASGEVKAESGFSLLQLNRTFWGRNFAAPVAPGTQFITLGGMVSADVHGKDHHATGGFGAHVREIRMRLASGDIVTASRTENADLFKATIGGMGLLGHILDVTFKIPRIPSPWVAIETERMPDLESYLAGLKDAAGRFPFTMGWIDTLGAAGKLGRGVLMRGRWADPHEARPGVPQPLQRPGLPFVLPEFAISRMTVAAFNSFYYGIHPSSMRRKVAHPEAFFYPLDAIRNWNLLYGRRGFTQYQCVIPEAAGPEGVKSFVSLLRRTGGSSMVSVIKDCGDEGEGLLSFPMRGTSVAADFPARERVQQIVDTLNGHLIELGGRIYLAKDRFTRAEDYRKMDARIDAWKEVKRRYDPKGRLRSAQSARLELT